MQRKLTCTLGLALALAVSSAWAQQAAEQRDPVPSSGAIVTNSAYRSSTITGMAVRNSEGDELGKIEDLVIDLNSGETKGFDEAVFYQGAVHDRVLILTETIQFQVLDRIAASGGPKLQLIVDEPGDEICLRPTAT